MDPIFMACLGLIVAWAIYRSRHVSKRQVLDRVDAIGRFTERGEAGPRRSTSSGDASWHFVQRIHARLADVLDSRPLPGSLDEAAQFRFIQNASEYMVMHLCVEHGISPSGSQIKQMVQNVLDEVTGLDPIEALLRDPTVDAIVVEAPDRVLVEVAGERRPSNRRFRDDGHVLDVIRRAVEPLRHSINESEPTVEAQLANGWRLSACIPPAPGGLQLTIRR